MDESNPYDYDLVKKEEKITFQTRVSNMAAFCRSYRSLCIFQINTS